MKPCLKLFHGVVCGALLSSGAALAAPATVGTFTNAAPGGGLDLQGYFTYAVNVGPDGGVGKIGDALFTGDNIGGVSVTANNQIAKGGWGAVNYGSSADDQALSTVMDSIRWAAAPTVLTVTLKVETGIEYKLQLLFHEDCCPGRGFNIVLNGVTEVPNFMPGPNQAGNDDFTATKNSIGSVITKQFIAATNVYTIVLDGPSADSGDISDHNATLCGFTLERISAVTDVDKDGLQDDWEQKFFGNLDQGPNDDPDHDGLSNLQEQAIGTDPTKADSDGDGLSDGDEVNKYKTDPLSATGDADKDLLTDAAEIGKYHTDPAKADTDGDGASDYYEVHVMTNPLDPASKPNKTTINLFTGPDAGQGLDFTGNFLYAISFGDAQPGGQIHDANFTADDVDGVTVESSHVANDWNTDVNFGDSPEQQVLTSIMSSIRWSDYTDATFPAVTVTLAKLQVGASYKLQMLFGENQWARGYNVIVNSKTIVSEFAPYQWQGGFISGNMTVRTNGVVVTYSFIANTTNAVIVLDGRPVTDPSMGDHNSIIEGLTLEVLAPPADTDKDGLWDAWEMDQFGNLNQTGTGDPDNDGLTNAQEFTAGTDPNKADSDGDGLSDGDEINKYHTDPLKADTDGDGLSDGDEVNKYHTDPLKADTDGDGISDFDEVMFYHTDPLKSAPVAVFTNIVVGMFTGGDPGEGLDLQGNFKYAFNVSSAGAAGKAGDANFTADNAPGIKVTAGNDIPNWDTPDLGTSANDLVLDKVLQSIRYTPTVTVELSDLVPESTYKIQLLFYEQCCAGRGFNVYEDGVLVAANFSPPAVQGGGDPSSGVNNTAAGAVVSAEFLTHSDKTRITLTVNGRTDDTLTDPNAILDGLTLEVLKEGPATQKPSVSIAQSSGGVVITFQGTLQAADTVNGTYTDLPNASPATITPTGTQKYYRAKQ